MAATVQSNSLSLLAASNAIGQVCLDCNKDYIQCKIQDSSPEHCLSKGEKVIACTLKTLRQAEERCEETFKAYKTCLKDNDREYRKCRSEELAFQNCFGRSAGEPE